MTKFRKSFIVVLSVVLIAMVFGITLRNQNKITELEAKHAKMLETLNGTERDIHKKQADIDTKKLKSIQHVTGLDPKRVSSDGILAKEYFKPAFSWRNGDEYERARQDYMKLLGKKNTFTRVYLPKDTEIDTDDGRLSYIDFKKIRTTMDDLYIVPMTAEGDQVRYVAFVRYFMHKNANDLADKSALNASQAIVEFTASGDTNNRKISDVKARAGFSSSTDGKY